METAKCAASGFRRVHARDEGAGLTTVASEPVILPASARSVDGAATFTGTAVEFNPGNAIKVNRLNGVTIIDDDSIRVESHRLRHRRIAAPFVRRVYGRRQFIELERKRSDPRQYDTQHASASYG